MKLIIRKKPKDAPAPAPLVAREEPVKEAPKKSPKAPTTPAPTPLPPPPEARAEPVQKQITYVEKPLATCPEDHWKDPNKYRSPPPRACTFCKHSYSWPCDGKDSKCMNAKWVRDRQAQEKA